MPLLSVLSVIAIEPYTKLVEFFRIIYKHTYGISKLIIPLLEIVLWVWHQLQLWRWQDHTQPNPTDLTNSSSEYHAKNQTVCKNIVITF